MVYWIWLAEALGHGNYRVNDIIVDYESAENFYRVGEAGWKKCEFLSAKEVNLLCKTPLTNAQKIIDRCKELSQKIVTIEDPTYPEMLKNIDNPPAVLYVKGNIECLSNRLCISIVGTRSATLYGQKMAYKLGSGLAKAGVITVSGCALGIDCMAQRASLNAGGKTIGVLGCGINTKYLSKNEDLRNKISQSGALISEYPPDTKSSPWHFPVRNRIISGLSKGTVIVEAGEKSGALITANLSLEQNRDVFAVPGNVDSKESIGTNNLIKDCAKLVTCVDDILEEYEFLYDYQETKSISEDELVTHSVKEETITKFTLPAYLSSEARKLFDVLEDKPLSIDSLSELTLMPVSIVLQAVTELEMDNLVESFAGNRYGKVNL